MSGSSRGIMGGFVINARVGLGMTFIPAHLKNGQGVNDCCKFSAFVNDGRGENASPIIADFSAWGGLARSVAFGLPSGTSFGATFRVNSYKGRVYEQVGVDPATQQAIRQAMTNPDGSPKVVSKIGFVIERFNYGEPSEAQIAFEIQNNLRDPAWNSTPEGKARWQAQKQERAQWPQKPVEQHSKTYGYARLILPTAAESVFLAGLPEQYRRRNAVGTMAANVATVVTGGAINPNPTNVMPVDNGRMNPLATGGAIPGVVTGGAAVNPGAVDPKINPLATGGVAVETGGAGQVW